MLSSEKCMQKANPVDGILHARDQSLIFFYSVFSLFTVCCLFADCCGFLSFRADVVASLRGLRRALLKVLYVSVRTCRPSLRSIKYGDSLTFFQRFSMPCQVCIGSIMNSLFRMYIYQMSIKTPAPYVWNCHTTFIIRNRFRRCFKALFMWLETA